MVRVPLKSLAFPLFTSLGTVGWVGKGVSARRGNYGCISSQSGLGQIVIFPWGQLREHEKLQSGCEKMGSRYGVPFLDLHHVSVELFLYDRVREPDVHSRTHFGVKVGPGGFSGVRQS